MKLSHNWVLLGRFGIGFNSVYHITELPSFVSSTNVVLLDPQVRIMFYAALSLCLELIVNCQYGSAGPLPS